MSAIQKIRGFFLFLYARHKMREAEIVRRMNGRMTRE